MKYKEALDELNHVLSNQQTIRTKKLKVIIQSLNISLKDGENKGIIHAQMDERVKK